VVTGLYPGIPAVTLSGTFDNPNVHPVNISSVTAAVHAFSVQSNPAKPACTNADFAIGGSFAGPYAVPAGSGVGAWTGLTVRLLDNGLNQDNCKTVSITIDYTARGRNWIVFSGTAASVESAFRVEMRHCNPGQGQKKGYFKIF
jgi:hypothetical protein